MPTKGFPYAGMARDSGARAANRRKRSMFIGVFTLRAARLSGPVASAKTRLLSARSKPDFAPPRKKRENEDKKWERRNQSFPRKKLSQKWSRGGRAPPRATDSGRFRLARTLAPPS